MNRDISWVCDPVFLLSSDHYKKIASKIIDERYAVVYLSEESELLDFVVDDIKRTLGCKIILIGGNRTRCNCDYHYKDLGPIDFISLLMYSEMVISSSFHATAFSHIFHKKFGVILPRKNGERMISLLELSNLQDRIINNQDDVKNIYNEIDFNEVDKYLEPFISSSKEYLLTNLK